MEERSLKVELESILTEKRVCEERFSKMTTEADQLQKLITSQCQLLLSEDKMKREYNAVKINLERSMPNLEVARDRNREELDELLRNFDSQVRQFKDSEQQAAQEIKEEMDEKVKQLNRELGTLEDLIREERRNLAVRSGELKQPFQAKRIEMERNLRVKQAELEIEVEGLENDIEATRVNLEKEIATETESMKKREFEWMNKVQRMKSSLERKRPESPEPGPCLNQSSVTAEEPRNGRRKLPLSISFKLDDDDML